MLLMLEPVVATCRTEEQHVAGTSSFSLSQQPAVLSSQNEPAVSATSHQPTQQAFAVLNARAVLR
jgi:hypothetical protein